LLFDFEPGGNVGRVVGKGVSGGEAWIP
jgi:hypothetical protein